MIDTRSRAVENIRMIKKFAFAILAVLLVVASGCSDPEGDDWKTSIDADTPDAYRVYIAKYPQGKHAEMAKYHLERMVYRNALDSKTLADYRAYLKEFPTGHYVTNARTQLSAIISFQVRQMPDEKLASSLVRFETDHGNFTMKVFPDKAPKTCRNFLSLAMAGFYDGLKFFYADPMKLVQTGDPRGDSMGGPGYFIPFEETGLKHVRGAVSMWHTNQGPNTAGSQFFICLEDMPKLDGKYAVFGEVTEGIETLEAISKLNTNSPPSDTNVKHDSQAQITRVTVEGIEVK